MSTARLFRGAWKLSKLTPPRIAWILLTKIRLFPFALIGVLWGLVATEDRFTHLYNTHHMAAGPADWTQWVPGVGAIVLGFAGIVWFMILIVDKTMDTGIVRSKN